MAIMLKRRAVCLPDGNRDGRSLVVVALDLLNLFSQGNKVTAQLFGSFGG